MAENKEELKSLLIKVKEESENECCCNFGFDVLKHGVLDVFFQCSLCLNHLNCVQIYTCNSISVQLLNSVQLFATPWTAACQASLSITNSLSLHKLMSIESVMQSNHLILCRPLLLPPSIFPSIRLFSNEPALCIRWTKYCSFSFNISFL